MELTLTSIHKSFGNTEVLKDISFSVKEGEFVSILGPSGSGKSTLFSIVGGLLQPNKGEVLLNEKAITGKSGYISYMPQQPSLFPWRTLLDNVVLGQELHGNKDVKMARELLEIAGLGEFSDAYPHQLSGGMKQRAAFIRAMLSPQKIMCLDEPFSALDAFTRLDMQKWLLKTWQNTGQSILFITHDMDEAIFLSDKIVILTQGPAEINDIIEVPFNRPRDESLLLSYPFLELKRTLANTVKKH